LKCSLFVTLIILGLWIAPAQAEYRVYQYYIKAKFPVVQDSGAYLVTSSLDPGSYIAYHGGSENITIDLLRTWMCPGHTGNMRQYCKSPYDKVSEMEKLTKK